MIQFGSSISSVMICSMNSKGHELRGTMKLDDATKPHAGRVWRVRDDRCSSQKQATSETRSRRAQDFTDVMCHEANHAPTCQFWEPIKLSKGYYMSFRIPCNWCCHVLPSIAVSTRVSGRVSATVFCPFLLPLSAYGNTLHLQQICVR